MVVRMVYVELYIDFMKKISYSWISKYTIPADLLVTFKWSGMMERDQILFQVSRGEQKDPNSDHTHTDVVDGCCRAVELLLKNAT